MPKSFTNKGAANDLVDIDYPCKLAVLGNDPITEVTLVPYALQIRPERRGGSRSRYPSPAAPCSSSLPPETLTVGDSLASPERSSFRLGLVRITSELTAVRLSAGLCVIRKDMQAQAAHCASRLCFLAREESLNAPIWNNPHECHQGIDGYGYPRGHECQDNRCDIQ